MKRLFFCSQADKQEKIIFDSNQAHHALDVLRFAESDIIFVTNGSGIIWKCLIVKTNTKTKYLEAEKISIFSNTLNKIEIFLAVALIKKTKRLEWLIEKICEWGITQFIPMVSARSEKATYPIKRFEKIIIAACKQSWNPYFPKLTAPMSFSQVVNLNFPNGRKLICTPNAKLNIENIDSSSSNKFLILIGPEGGFTEQEIEMAEKNSWVSMGLNRFILRTETAALSTVILLHNKFD